MEERGLAVALIACPDCQSDVSDNAAACLKCGRPIKQPRPTFTPERLLFIGKLFIGLGALVALFGYVLFPVNVDPEGFAGGSYGCGTVLTPAVDDLRDIANERDEEANLDWMASGGDGFSAAADECREALPSRNRLVTLIVVPLLVVGVGLLVVGISNRRTQEALNA